MPKSQIELDLEENGNIILDGDFRDIAQLDHQGKAKVIGRDKFLEEV